MSLSQVSALKVDGHRADAARFYAIACDPGLSVAVEACAGAGKTWMLVSRMLRALLSDTGSGACQPHEILAITFTRKAAGEMRERLYEWLQEFAHADQDRLMQGLRERGVPGLEHPDVAAALCVRLRGLYGSLLASGRTVQIRTFHGWFSSLLRMAPVALLQQLKLPVHYELLEDDTQAKDLAWRRFLAALIDHPAAKADFQALVQTHGRSQAQKALLLALDKRVEFELADAAGTVQTSVRTIDQQFARCAGLSTVRELLFRSTEAQLLMQAAKVLQGLRAKTFSALGADLERALVAGDLDGVIDSLLTGQSSGRGPRAFGQAGSNEAVRQAQGLAQELLQMQRQEQAWAHQQRMTRLTRVLIGQFRALKLERGWMDMNDIEQAAVHLLSDDVLSGWVQERLDAQVRHLLVDEFQDTNPMQWQALRSWLQSYAGAGRAPSVFIVGDPKQSIYRFRRAEPQVFRDAQQFVRSALGGALLSCDHTRRNARQVIEVVNAVMADAQSGDNYAGFGEHTTQSEQTGQVVSLPVVDRPIKADAVPAGERPWRDSLTQPRWLPEERQRDLEAAQAAAWIAQQISDRKICANDVMVLSRKRDSLEPMQLALRARGVPASIGEKIALMDCCEVQDLVALMDVLVSPRHNLSLARVLRSPLFGLDTSALVPLAQAAERTGRSWLSVLQDGASVAELDQTKALVLQPLGAILTRWQGWLRALPPHDALQAIYDDGDVLARYAAAAPDLLRDSVLSHLRALLEVALGHDGGRYLTAYALVRALRAGTIEVPATLRSDAVRLLTIHGAKGLEADTVLMLDTDAAPRNPDNMSVLVDWPGHLPHPRTFVFLESESRPPPCAVGTLAADLQARSREELNALYVAMTRARKVLAVSACVPFRDSGRSWRKRLDPWTLALEGVGPASPGAASAQDRATPARVLLPSLPEWVRVDSRPEAGQRPEAPSPLARIGLAMHRLLEWGAASPEHLRLAAREFRLDPDQRREAGEAAQRILQGQGAWIWSSTEIVWQGSEVELIHQGRLLRLDRLVQHRDGTWWVLDFKSHAQPQVQDAMVQQLSDYAQAVRALHPGQRVRAAFLTAQGQVREIALAS